MKFGLIVDSHGTSLKEAVDFFNNENVDFILFNGDLQGYSKQNNLKESLLELAESNSNVYVIPGSHESAFDYNSAMREITKEFEHIKDKGNGINLTQIDDNTELISYGGCTWSPLKNPYFINPLLDVSKISVLMYKNKDKNIILQMHEPPKNYGDVAEFVILESGARMPLASLKDHPQFEIIKQYAKKENVGDENLEMLIEGKLTDTMPKVVTFGHIHESYKNLSPGQEIPTKREVAPREKVSNLSLNPGPYMEGRLAIVELEDDVSYRLEKLF